MPFWLSNSILSDSTQTGPPARSLTAHKSFRTFYACHFMVHRGFDAASLARGAQQTWLRMLCLPHIEGEVSSLPTSYVKQVPRSQRMQCGVAKLPQELKDDIFELGFTPKAARARMINQDYKPPTQLQVNRGTRKHSSVHRKFCGLGMQRSAIAHCTFYCHRINYVALHDARVEPQWELC